MCICVVDSRRVIFLVNITNLIYLMKKFHMSKAAMDIVDLYYFEKLKFIPLGGFEMPCLK